MLEARLKTSQKRVSFPGDICQLISQSLHEQFPEAAKGGKFVVEGWIFPSEMILRTGYLPNGQLRQRNFEASLDFQPLKEKTVDRIQVLTTACLAFMASHF